MIIVDDALRARAAAGDPIRVGLVGAGFMGRAIANQIINSVPGMELVAISNRHLGPALRAYAEAGVTDVDYVENGGELDWTIARGRVAATDDPTALCDSEEIDALIEVTGAVEFAAGVVLRAIQRGKHVVLMDAELDGTVGPILKAYADQAGVVLTTSDGDQPGVQMNLFRFVKSIGLTPMVVGNIKGLHDPYRTPKTQELFAKQWGQRADMVTSFADGTKISFEQAIVANATGLNVPKRGLNGFEHRGHVDELTQIYDLEELRRMGGIVDYVVGAKPAPGVFVLATHDDPRQRHYLKLYKLGDGPLYSFYTPYHLCHFEAPLSVARAVLFHDAVMSPLAGPRAEVVATAKTDLRAGEVLDRMGQYMTYGLCERADVTAEQGLLPIGVAEGCVLTRPVPKDQVLTYADVAVPPGRLVDRLRAEQATYFGMTRRPPTALEPAEPVGEPSVVPARSHAR